MATADRAGGGRVEPVLGGFCHFERVFPRSAGDRTTLRLQLFLGLGLFALLLQSSADSNADD